MKPPFRSRVPAPPSSLTGDLGTWARQVYMAINSMPFVSYFSGTNPNSNTSGFAGDLAVNVGSASTDSRIWVMGGNSLSVTTNLGWVVLRTNK